MKKYGMIIVIIIVTLLVSLFFAKKEIRMEDLKGKTEAEVTQYASLNGLLLTIEKEYSGEVEEGKVISQSIKVGSVIKKNKKLTVVISLGEEVIDYASYQVDELGRVPIMMYHGIHDLKNEDTEYIGGNVDRDGYQRTAEAFRKDLIMYYEKGYRMISLQDYIDGKIDVPLGKSPIILTFDDGLRNNIRVIGVKDGKIEIDPNCAVGILEEMKQKYPDFQVTATFFVNGGIFNQKEYEQEIIDYLLDHGYDIGNHTLSHPDFTKLTYEDAVKEVGYMSKLLSEKTKGKAVFIVALPFGSPYRKTHPTYSAIIDGTYEGYTYHNVGALQVGWESNYSPFSKSFDPEFMKRIRAYDNNGEDFDIEMNFRLLENNRFISDGKVDQITLPKESETYLRETNRSVVVY